MKKNLVLFFASLIFMIVLCELILRFFPVIDPYGYLKAKQQLFIPSQFPVNAKLSFCTEPGLPGCSGDTTRFTVNNMGFRGDSLLMPKPENEYRIFVVGGSAAECLYLDDSVAWPIILQKELQRSSSRTIRVYNGGKSGDFSPDHLSLVVHRIVQLQPDMVIVMSGVNDLLRSIAKYDFLHFTQDSDHDQWGAGHWAKLFLTEFQIGRRAFFLLKKVHPWATPDQQWITIMSGYRAHADALLRMEYSDSIPTINLSSYASNLAGIAGACNAFGSTLFFMRQQSTWNNPSDSVINQWHWLNNRDNLKYREPVMDSLLQEYNRIMDRVAGQFTIPLFPTDKIVPKTHEYFYDDCHFNSYGSRFVGRKLAEFVIGYIP
jgi:lysophospholipase L1-like esterase